MAACLMHISTQSRHCCCKPVVPIWSGSARARQQMAVRRPRRRRHSLPDPGRPPWCYACSVTPCTLCWLPGEVQDSGANGRLVLAKNVCRYVYCSAPAMGRCKAHGTLCHAAFAASAATWTRRFQSVRGLGSSVCLLLCCSLLYSEDAPPSTRPMHAVMGVARVS